MPRPGFNSRTQTAAARLPRVRGSSGYRVSPWVPYAFLVPAILLFAAFSIYPILRALTWSFTDMTLLAPDSARWVGVQNYVDAIHDPELFEWPSGTGMAWLVLRWVAWFVPIYIAIRVILPAVLGRPQTVAKTLRETAWVLPAYILLRFLLVGAQYGNGAFWNTVRFAAWLLPAYIVVPLLLAAMLEKLARGQALLRTLIFVPVIISMAVAAVIWVMIYDLNYGIINLGILHVRNGLNAVISWIGGGTDPYFTFDPPNWLGDQRWAMPALAIMSFWNGMGLNVLLYLVGLNRIDTELYEAARVDGAGALRQFWAITLPMLRPTTYLVVLLSAIGAMHVFGQMYIMTQGGPANSTQSFVMYLYKVAFSPMRNCEFGYASALAFILAGGIFVLSALSQRLNRAADEGG
jgi:multiple sugar transport system permease protein